MTDPNIRRLLDATKPADGDVLHYTLRRDYTLTATERFDALNTISRRAQAINQTEVKGPTAMDEILTDALNQSRRYDEQVFRDMGVGVIWFKAFDDIPKLLDAFAPSPKSPSKVPKPRGNGRRSVRA